jgi:hypothetical protein
MVDGGVHFVSAPRVEAYSTFAVFFDLETAGTCSALTRGRPRQKTDRSHKTA